MRTGVAHLRSYPEARLLELAFQQGTPEVLSTPIMHEIIHHACANSAVNIAMQYRWLELMRQIMSTSALGVAVHQDHMEMAASLAAVEAIFQPLAEGIAHFAEFDCTVPESRIVSEGCIIGPSDALLWRLLGMKENIGSHIDELFGQLKSEQLDSRIIKRKADVLCNQIQPQTGNDTYLIGYLTIKSLWNQYLERAGDTPLRAASFLHFILYYIYEDWFLAGTITMPGSIHLGAIIDRISNRIKQLFTADLSNEVKVFTDDVLSREKERKLRMRGEEELKYGAFAGLRIYLLGCSL